jgi:hypothetical protein
MPFRPRPPRPSLLAQVNRALVRHGLPFGAKAAQPKPLETYPFSFDPKARPPGIAPRPFKGAPRPSIP